MPNLIDLLRSVKPVNRSIKADVQIQLSSCPPLISVDKTYDTFSSQNGPEAQCVCVIKTLTGRGTQLDAADIMVIAGYHDQLRILEKQAEDGAGYSTEHLDDGGRSPDKTHLSQGRENSVVILSLVRNMHALVTTTAVLYDAQEAVRKSRVQNDGKHLLVGLHPKDAKCPSNEPFSICCPCVPTNPSAAFDITPGMNIFQVPAVLPTNSVEE
ncbi:hypothetical protein PV08_07710 [Exophiala spinifera]|uniref:DNA2/NAM7 helicase-like C-terminal domain-containing protein n=1 Tax=Exophiala spinifera TaxID=91928 RepID=A0A0D2BUK6_9EURO|nr:uncharacterized protein PV08_07710 [Exophiala spinifera]KIW14924.1 hypothetical protein PV08_07710 [Exophiala spinifera]